MEFWPQDRWPGTVIPRPSWCRRLLCRIFGHIWDTHYWSGAGEPGWPQHEYCLRCWKFRDKP